MVLRSANIQFCDMCVVISSIDRVVLQDESHLIDKSAILCSLNIKAVIYDGLFFNNKVANSQQSIPFTHQLKIQTADVDAISKNMFTSNIPSMLTELSTSYNVVTLDARYIFV